MAILQMPPIGSTHFRHLYISRACLKELIKIMEGSGIRKDFQTWLLDRLREIDDISSFSYPDVHPRRYEKIGKFFNIAYRHNEKNIRILFYKADNENINILICAIDEKKTRADYTRLIRLANTRLKEGLEKDYE